MKKFKKIIKFIFLTLFIFFLLFSFHSCKSIVRGKNTSLDSLQGQTFSSKDMAYIIEFREHNGKLYIDKDELIIYYFNFELEDGNITATLYNVVEISSFNITCLNNGRLYIKKYKALLYKVEVKEE